MPYWKKSWNTFFWIYNLTNFAFFPHQGQLCFSAKLKLTNMFEGSMTVYREILLFIARVLLLENNILSDSKPQSTSLVININPLLWYVSHTKKSKALFALLMHSVHDMVRGGSQNVKNRYSPSRLWTWGRYSLYIVVYLCSDLKGMVFGMFCPF